MNLKNFKIKKLEKRNLFVIGLSMAIFLFIFQIQIASADCISQSSITSVANDAADDPSDVNGNGVLTELDIDVTIQNDSASQCKYKIELEKMDGTTICNSFSITLNAGESHTEYFETRFGDFNFSDIEKKFRVILHDWDTGAWDDSKDICCGDCKCQTCTESGHCDADCSCNNEEAGTGSCSNDCVFSGGVCTPADPTIVDVLPHHCSVEDNSFSEDCDYGVEVRNNDVDCGTSGFYVKVSGSSDLEFNVEDSGWQQGEDRNSIPFSINSNSSSTSPAIIFKVREKSGSVGNYPLTIETKRDGSDIWQDSYVAFPVIFELTAGGTTTTTTTIPGSTTTTTPGISGLNLPNKPISDIIADLVDWFLTLVTVIAILMLIIGGVMYLVATGDEMRLQSAKRIIVYALIGLFICGISYIIVKTIADIITK